MVTLKHIADEAGVSAGAVSKVLNGRAAEARISRERAAQISRIAARLNYHPNAAARSMRSRRTGHVGLLIPNDAQFPGTNPQSYGTIVGVNLGLESAGYVLSLVRISDVAVDHHQPTAAAAGRGSRVFTERMLDGMIVITHVPTAFAERVERLVPKVVWADANVWRTRNCIRRDEYHAGRTAGDAAAAAGYRRIAWFGTDAADVDTHYSHGDRFGGVRQSAAAHGLELVVVQSDWTWRPPLARALAPLLRPDTAIVATDVLRARLVARAALEYRRTPGVDFGLVCCEDTPEIASTWPDLARVEFDRVELGRRAADMAARLLRDAGGADHASYRLSGRWIPGATLAPAARVAEQTSPARPARLDSTAGASATIPSELDEELLRGAELQPAEVRSDSS